MSFVVPQSNLTCWKSCLVKCTEMEKEVFTTFQQLLQQALHNPLFHALPKDVQIGIKATIEHCYIVILNRTIQHYDDQLALLSSATEDKHATQQLDTLFEFVIKDQECKESVIGGETAILQFTQYLLEVTETFVKSWPLIKLVLEIEQDSKQTSHHPEQQNLNKHDLPITVPSPQGQQDQHNQQGQKGQQNHQGQTNQQNQKDETNDDDAFMTELMEFVDSKCQPPSPKSDPNNKFDQKEVEIQTVNNPKEDNEEEKQTKQDSKDSNDSPKDVPQNVNDDEDWKALLNELKLNQPSRPKQLGLFGWIQQYLTKNNMVDDMIQKILLAALKRSLPKMIEFFKSKAEESQDRLRTATHSVYKLFALRRQERNKAQVVEEWIKTRLAKLDHCVGDILSFVDLECVLLKACMSILPKDQDDPLTEQVIQIYELVRSTLVGYKANLRTMLREFLILPSIHCPACQSEQNLENKASDNHPNQEQTDSDSDSDSESEVDKTDESQKNTEPEPSFVQQLLRALKM